MNVSMREVVMAFRKDGMLVVTLILVTLLTRIIVRFQRGVVLLFRGVCQMMRL
jgi:hypothetical protein